MGLIDEIGAGPVALDTVVFIYFIEENPRFLRAVEPVFEAIDEGKLKATTSSLTLLEVLVVPFRAGNIALAGRYEQALTRGRGLSLIDLDRAQLRAAAQLRSVFPKVRTPDALQLSAALSAGCSAFLTNDRQLPVIPSLRILQLESYST